MPTPSHDPKSGLSLLADDIFGLLRDLTAANFEQLSAATREANNRTSRWHFGQRQQMDVADIYISGKPATNVLAEIRKQGQR